MRIIAGSCRGKRLFTPGGHGIRPTPDKVKGAIFNMIGASQEDAVALDLFSGTGSMGLEALSRGARRCYFCDNSAESLALIRKNAAHCNMEARAKILSGDYMRTLDAIPEKMDVIFLDPPYSNDYYVNCMERIAAAGILQEDGLIVAEHSANRPFPDEIAGFVKVKEKKYGITGVTIFERQMA